MTRKQNSDIVIMEDQAPFAKLYCYASGDGSLSFNWAETRHPMPSINKEVTRAQVEKYLSKKENAHLKDSHVISERWGQINLIPLVQPAGAGKLKYKGEIYDVVPVYYTDSEGRKRLSRHETKITFTYPADHPLGAETFEVKNISIRAALCYYLENRRWRYRDLEFKPKSRGANYIRLLFNLNTQKTNGELGPIDMVEFERLVEEGYQLMKLMYYIDYKKKFKEFRD
jgi:hypothetical protein